MLKLCLHPGLKRFVFLMGVVITPIFSFADIHSKLKEISQEHILQYWQVLSEENRQQLRNQIEQLDVDDFYAQQQSISATVQSTDSTITPFLDYSIRGSYEDFQIGKQLIADGKVGCLIVAGGQGSRLGFEGPKGVFPVTVVKDKSLFQLFAEKVLAAGKQANRPLHLAIMTSSANHEDTIAHFKNNNYFGLDETFVTFFMQHDLPLLDLKGNLFLETPSRIAAGPDGNAPSLKQFVEQGIWEEWEKVGVSYLIYIPIDNPLADPFDAELIGFHHRHQSDLVIKCIERSNPLEKLGVILRKNNQVDVIEYSEISDLDRNARDEKGQLWHRCGNISLFSFRMDFIYEIAKHHYRKFPNHLAWKAVKYLTPEGETKTADKPMAWKFEKFIFDVLPFAQSVKALLYPREECFAPLKNAKSPDSIVEVREALLQADRKVLGEITRTTMDENSVFELDPQFYYPTPELLDNWKGRKGPFEGYINP